jgi:hypothetical protein
MGHAGYLVVRTAAARPRRLTGCIRDGVQWQRAEAGRGVRPGRVNRIAHGWSIMAMRALS